MYLLIVFLPLMASILVGAFGRFLGARGSAVVTISAVACSCLLSVLAFYEVALCSCTCSIKLGSWMFAEMFDARWGFLFDTLTVVMLVVVTLVSTLVHIYSVSYMSEDPFLPRFMCWLCIFTFFMLMLVTADNLLQMFLGWEGVGLASYLLINFWFTRLQANKAAIKAMLVNRVGDFGLALGIMACFTLFHSVDFQTVFACASEFVDRDILFFNVRTSALDLTCTLLFIGAVGKSAQIGLHTWLPDAMEGPTPVSALIHAATMVTAGVFLIARCSPLFEYAPVALQIVTVVGAMTCLFAATTGMFQNDLKRVIAYSTCSQLGYMVFACGLSNYSVSVFHLMNHAFFKALLFLSAGSVIHAMSDEQDMRKMGGLASVLPFTYAMMFIGSLALVGFPFLAGFYSKDVIIETAYACYTRSGTFAYWLGSVCVLFTSYYSFRLLVLTFLAPSNARNRPVLSSAHDAPPVMALPLLILAVGSIFVGYLASDMMIGAGTPFWGNSLATLPAHAVLLEAEFLPAASNSTGQNFIKMLPVFSTLTGALLAFVLHYAQPGNGLAVASYVSKTQTLVGNRLYAFFNQRWLFDGVYNTFLVRKCLDFAYEVCFRTLDKGVIEMLGPYGISHSIRTAAFQVSSLQSGFVYHYAFVMLVALTIFMTVIGFWDLRPSINIDVMKMAAIYTLSCWWLWFGRTA